jgi:hypothetical protein
MNRIKEGNSTFELFEYLMHQNILNLERMWFEPIFVSQLKGLLTKEIFLERGVRGQKVYSLYAKTEDQQKKASSERRGSDLFIQLLQDVFCEGCQGFVRNI